MIPGGCVRIRAIHVDNNQQELPYNVFDRRYRWAIPQPRRKRNVTLTHVKRSHLADVPTSVREVDGLGEVSHWQCGYTISSSGVGVVLSLFVQLLNQTFHALVLADCNVVTNDLESPLS